MKKILIFAASCLAMHAAAQDKPTIKVTGYLETYYGYDLNKPADNNRPGFIYSHNRHNEVNLNLGFIKANYDSETVRGNIALMTGTYANANLAAEPGLLKNIFEANAGLKLSRAANLWVDAGIFSSHIGYESAVSKDTWALTRNIASENTPYYESGVKLGYTSPNGKFSANVLYLNGWQRIARQDGNSQPAGGLQVTFKPVHKISLNYSNYLGTEGIDADRVRRTYHNFYGIMQFTEQFGVTLGFDYGRQQITRGNSAVSEVFSPVAIAQYKFNTRFAMAGRVEHYSDAGGIFIATATPNGFKTTGYSLNIDYAPITNALVRLEGKTYSSKDAVFLKSATAVDNNTALTASIALSF